MEQNILKEELSISNDVNKIVSQLKSVIGDNYNKNKDNINKYISLPNFQNSIFHNKIIVNLKNISISIVINYYVLLNASKNIESKYLSLFKSSSDIEKYEIDLYLTALYNKIEWEKHSSTIQHEVEHMYQLFRKNKPLMTDKQLFFYNKMIILKNSSDYLTKIIGFTYYFYNKIEKNAFMNGIYREIIDSYVTGLNTPTIELIKNTQIYKNIQVIKNIVTNKDNWPDLEMRLKLYNITLKSYLKIANIMIQEYTKSFGRTLYKINKDIDEINKTKLINLSNISLENNN